MAAFAPRTLRTLCLCALMLSSAAHAQNLLIDGFEGTPLKPAPVVVIERDDRVATLSMDYNAANPWGQFWTMTGAPTDDAGFLVTWWPQATSLQEKTRLIADNDSGGSCLNPDHLTAPLLGRKHGPVCEHLRLPEPVETLLWCQLRRPADLVDFVLHPGWSVTGFSGMRSPTCVLQTPRRSLRTQTS